MKLSTRELTVFAMPGALMYASKMIMEVSPNVHLLGVFTVAFTVVYRKKALYPIYTYVLLYIICCSLHGFLFGTLYAPAQAILYGMGFKATIARIIAGLPWDAIHGVSNLVCGLLIMPIVKILTYLENRAAL